MYRLHLAGGHCPLRGLDAPCARWELYEISITLVNAQARRCVAQLSDRLPIRSSRPRPEPVKVIRSSLHHLGTWLEVQGMVVGRAGVSPLLMRKL